MGVSLLYESTGRIRGHFVYALQCSDASKFLIKIGNSIDPMSRLDQIRTHCPYVPELFATMRFVNRDEACTAESMFHVKLKPFRIHGEWFAFEKTDKMSFNAATAAVRGMFVRPNWPLRWVKINVPSLVAQKAQKKAYAFRKYKIRGRSYHDALAHGMKPLR